MIGKWWKMLFWFFVSKIEDVCRFSCSKGRVLPCCTCKLSKIQPVPPRRKWSGWIIIQSNWRMWEEWKYRANPKKIEEETCWPPHEFLRVEGNWITCVLFQNIFFWSDDWGYTWHCLRNHQKIESIPYRFPKYWISHWENQTNKSSTRQIQIFEKKSTKPTTSPSRSLGQVAWRSAWNERSPGQSWPPPDSPASISDPQEDRKVMKSHIQHPTWMWWMKVLLSFSISVFGMTGIMCALVILFYANKNMQDTQMCCVNARWSHGKQSLATMS